MARIRTIKPELFRHERLYDAERASKLPLRLAFAGLFTAADREGRFNWAPRALKLDCLPYDDVDFEKVLDALHEHGFIIKYEIEGRSYGAIPSWKQHQHVNIREAASTIPEPSDANTCTHVHAHGEGKGRERKGNDICRVEDPTEQLFEEFWKAKPRRKGDNPKSPAKKLFCSLARQGADPQAMVLGARQWAANSRDKIDTEFIPQAVKWLRDRRWEDYAPDPGDPEKLKSQMEFMRLRGYQLVDDKWVKIAEANHPLEAANG